MAAPRRAEHPGQRRPHPAEHMAMLNRHARMMIKKHALPRLLPISSISVAAAGTVTTNNNVVNIVPQAVGLLTRFVIRISFKVAVTGGTAATLTNLGLANIVSRFQFTDLQNNVRISTPGWHIALINTIRGRRPHATVWPVIDAAGGLDTGIASMGTYGNNWPDVIQGPTGGSIASGANSTMYVEYEVPIAYSDDDLTGAVYLNVVNATAQLQMQLNAANLSSGATGDPSGAVFSGATNANCTLSNINITVYQQYYDQLPNWGHGDKRQPILPPVDISTIYGIYDTTLSSIQTNQDFPSPYANFRDFLATYLLLDNQTGGAYPTPGSDVTYFELLTANFTQIWKKDPYLAAKEVRAMIGADLPVPVYYFDSRKRPISTTQQGNMQLIQNMPTVNTGAYNWLAYEYFSRINTITGAASLPGT